MVKKRKYSALQYTYNRMNNGQIKGALLFSDVCLAMLLSGSRRLKPRNSSTCLVLIIIDDQR